MFTQWTYPALAILYFDFLTDSDEQIMSVMFGFLALFNFHTALHDFGTSHCLPSQASHPDPVAGLGWNRCKGDAGRVAASVSEYVGWYWFSSFFTPCLIQFGSFDKGAMKILIGFNWYIVAPWC